MPEVFFILPESPLQKNKNLIVAVSFLASRLGDQAIECYW